MEAVGHNHIRRDAVAHHRLHPAYVVCSERQAMAMEPGVTQALNTAAEWAQRGTFSACRLEKPALFVLTNQRQVMETRHGHVMDWTATRSVQHCPLVSRNVYWKPSSGARKIKEKSDQLLQ